MSNNDTGDDQDVESNAEPLKRGRRAAGDYDVGYGKPPKQHQFPNRWSNTKGRLKGSLSLKTQLKKLIEQPVIVTEKGKRSQRSTLNVLLMKLRADALAGKPKSH